MSQFDRSFTAPFERQTRQPGQSKLPASGITAEWAWHGSTGAGVKIAVIDSGIESGHPAVGEVQGYARIEPDASSIDTGLHDDVYGHGTACAGIIRQLAPDCDLYSVRVLGPTLSGKGDAFVMGLRWAIENRMDVCNLSLGTTRSAFMPELRELAELAYFQGTILVAAANNSPVASYPSVFSSVIGVASHDERGNRIYYNPAPPVEFGAPGIDVRVAWKGGTWLTTTGNSFAAPFVTGRIAQLLGKHPGLSPFEVKTVLRILAS